MKKDLKPLLEAQKNKFFKKYPDTDYAIDLRFKKDLIENQLAAKEFTLQNIIFQHKNGFLLLKD